ncbi:replication initiator protein A [Ilyobacter polytropus]|uniref:Uncharacterized protein n=1 Tax=Ilyobacter polytropus (strain ATCC 51220 / DSM 2926 / LMG 16218 / CuHBu1) TaxID=572544 RepID=E3HBS3_ILYPC|nr:replication initiator protein A [Ilyobacter polytropus]ADO83835.1 hypothetical protein Ilyop_2065 [Ilyobacter polytropus DSM 2926]
MAKRLTAKDMEKKEFYQMPKWIYEIKGLKSLHREIYMLALNNYNLSRNNGWINGKGEVYFKLSYAALVDFTGARRETINKAIGLLVEIGLLEAEKKNGTATKYFITEPEIDEIKEKTQSKTSTKNSTSTENSTGTKNSTATSTENRTDDQYEKPYPNKNNTNRLNKINISMQKSDFENYCELVSKATDTPLMRVQMCINPSDLKNHSTKELVKAISESKYLQGLSNKKPPIKTFTGNKQLDKIIGGFYKDSDPVENAIPTVPDYYSSLKEVESW